MEDLDWYENKHESKEKKRGFERTEDLDWYKNMHEFKEKKRGFEWTEDLDWYRNKHEFMEKKDGVLNKRKIWTDIGISMNLMKKNMAFWMNGRFGLTWE